MKIMNKQYIFKKYIYDRSHIFKDNILTKVEYTLIEQNSGTFFFV